MRSRRCRRPGRRGDRGDRRTRWPRGSRCRARVLSVSPRSRCSIRSGRPQVGERMPARIAGAPGRGGTNDRKDGQRGDRGQRQDVSRVDPGCDSRWRRCSQCENAESRGPTHVGNEERVRAASQGAEWPARGTRLHRGHERFRERLSVGNRPSGSRARHRIDRRGEPRWQTPARHVPRSASLLACRSSRRARSTLEGQTAAHARYPTTRAVDVAATIDRPVRGLLRTHEVAVPTIVPGSVTGPGSAPPWAMRSRSPARGPCPPRAGCCRLHVAMHDAASHA